MAMDPAAALVDGLGPGAPVVVAVFAGDGELVLASPSLADPEPLRALAAEVLATGRARPRAELRTDGGRRLVAAAHPLAGGRAGVIAVEARAGASDALAAAQRLAQMGWWRREGADAVTLSPELRALAGPDGEPALTAALREAGPAPVELALDLRRPDGTARTLRVRGEAAGPGAVEGFAQDVTDLVRATARQRALAELDEAALGDADEPALMDAIADAVAATLAVRRCAVVELAPGGNALLVRTLRPPGAAPLGPLAPGGGSFAGYTLRRREPVVVDDWRTETRFARDPGLSRGLRSGACVLVGPAEQPYGVLMAVADAPGRFKAEDIGFLQAVANVLADGLARRRTAAEIAELAAARGRLVAHALDAEERARRTMAERLHDSALQDLLAAGHDLWALGDAPGAVAARAALGDVVARLRSVMSALHPTVLAAGGLEAALRAVAAEHATAGGFAVDVEVDPAAAGERDELLLSVARELLGNAARHAAAAQVRVAVRREDGRVVLEVDDDGAGMAPDRAATALAEGHIGLAISGERAAAVGGALEVLPRDGGGTAVRVRVPAR